MLHIEAILTCVFECVIKMQVNIDYFNSLK